MITIDTEQSCDTAAIEILLDGAFGTDRSSKSSYFVRNETTRIPELSLVARTDDDLIVGSVRMWRVHIEDMLDGGHQDALLLGPLAVGASARGHGIGGMLMRRALARADLLGHTRIILVGDISYYHRFGFAKTLPRYISMPGRRDAGRLLVRQNMHTVKALPLVGRVVLPVEDAVSAVTDTVPYFTPVTDKVFLPA